MFYFLTLMVIFLGSYLGANQRNKNWHNNCQNYCRHLFGKILEYNVALNKFAAKICSLN